MKVIGFNFEEIHAKKVMDFKRSSINTDVVFNDIDKSKLDVLKDNETIRARFTFKVSYKDADKNSEDLKNEISINGMMLLMVTKDEAKDFIKSWKTKEIPKDKMIGLYNFILKKCSVKALQLEEELGLQPHIPFPQVKASAIKQQ